MRDESTRCSVGNRSSIDVIPAVLRGRGGGGGGRGEGVRGALRPGKKSAFNRNETHARNGVFVSQTI